MSRHAACALLMAFATACRTAAPGPDAYDISKVDTAPIEGGTFVEASIADASVLNPVLSQDAASNDICSLVFNGLVKYDKEIRLTGDLAESWEVSKDGRVITFRLRPGVKWHDGHPFTSADALFTYETLIASNTRTAFGSDFQLVEKVETPDPLTFRVFYREAFAPAIESWGMGILPRHIYAGADVNTHPANRSPIGTGPYRFKRWDTDEKIVLEANPDYFERKPRISRYVYRIVPDLSVQFLELRQGALSLMYPTPDQYNGYAPFFYAYNKFRYPAFRYDYLAFNLKNPQFQDVRVRRAIAHAIDKDAIIRGVYQNHAVRATGPFPPASWAFDPAVPDYVFDAAQARQLLAEAGWADSDGDGILDKDGRPFSFTITTNQGNKLRESMALIVQNNLGALGIKVDIRILEFSVFIDKFINDRQFEVCILGWNLARDPDCYTMWHSSQMGRTQYNFTSYSNKEVDRLLEEGRRTFGVEKRAPIYRRIHALIQQDVPYVFLVYPERLPVVHKKILGVEVTPSGIGHNFIDWFIPRAWQGPAALSS